MAGGSGEGRDEGRLADAGAAFKEDGAPSDLHGAEDAEGVEGGGGGAELVADSVGARVGSGRNVEAANGEPPVGAECDLRRGRACRELCCDGRAVGTVGGDLRDDLVEELAAHANGQGLREPRAHANAVEEDHAGAVDVGPPGREDPALRRAHVHELDPRKQVAYADCRAPGVFACKELHKLKKRLREACECGPRQALVDDVRKVLPRVERRHPDLCEAVPHSGRQLALPKVAARVHRRHDAEVLVRFDGLCVAVPVAATALLGKEQLPRGLQHAVQPLQHCVLCK